jgi:carboxypeptidase PM20D1
MTITIVSLIAGAVLVLAVVLAVRTWTFKSRQVAPRTAGDLEIDADAPERLSAAIQFETITSRDPDALDPEPYHDLHAYLQTAFPALHDTLGREVVNDLSLLYHWEGTDPGLDPVVLMAHVDVVPVDAPEAWAHPPFGGEEVDGYVYGRGALDDKASAIAIFESVETLVRAGYEPKRSIYLAIGHDEEVGGERGAKRLADRLSDLGVRPALVIDEGGAITVGAVPDVTDPVALIGVAEKGYLSVEILAEGMGGHSSVPPEETSIEAVMTAVQRLRDNPLTASLDGVTGQTFDYIAPEMSVPARMAFANMWLLRPAITWALSRDPTTDAAIRTTTAPTILDAGVKDNVVPSTARAVVNFRILPSESVEQVMEHVRRQLDGLPVSISTIQAGEPTAVSSMDDEWFDLVQRTIHEVTDDRVIVAPFLVPGTTDSRHYAPLSNHVYRFAPFRLTQDDKHRIHGIDERISVEDYRTMIRYYAKIIQNADGMAKASASGDGVQATRPATVEA